MGGYVALPSLLEEYCQQHDGDCLVPSNYKDDLHLAPWSNNSTSSVANLIQPIAKDLSHLDLYLLGRQNVAIQLLSFCEIFYIAPFLCSSSLTHI
jgi:hypothetical protein